ncbi:MAG: c-type cytochrome [Pirellulales bacterium]|nr:c-type cytochrome [Pirellulales bacterium]
MPSPDDTFYNIKRLHVVFALSSAALLGATVWMLAVDHRREWKVYQRTFRDRVEPWLTEAQLRQDESDRSAAREKELEEGLAKARAAVLDRALIDRFRDELAREAKRRGAQPPDLSQLEGAYRKLAGDPTAANRRELVEQLRGFVEAAGLRLDNADRDLRFRRADFDEARSGYEAAVGQGLPQARLDSLEQQAAAIRQDVARLTALRQAAELHNGALADILSQLTGEEDKAAESLAEFRAERERMRHALRQQTVSWGKEFLRLPLIDAFGSPLSVDQVWLPELTIDYNFRDVARFDRCTTCHLGMDKTQPGRPSEPACPPQQDLTVKLARPSAREDGDRGENQGDRRRTGEPAERSLEQLYGLSLAPRGILDPRAPTVGLVLPHSAAADALLSVGDVVLKINGQPIAGREQAHARLVELAAPSALPGEEQEADDDQAPPPIELKIRRGLPKPYCAHPRLDLFVGSLSPHPLAEFGCTVCHEGQGSATQFKFASHAPNLPVDQRRWQDDHGWLWNRHWDFPMRASRFAQSSCLRCHHDATELEPTERFPDPPAPKLLEGYHLVRRNGCFGCHEIKGILESGERVGPDIRLEPNYHEAALQLSAMAKLNDAQERLARQVIDHPDVAAARRELAESVLPGRRVVPRGEPHVAEQRATLARDLQSATSGSTSQPDVLALATLLAAEPPHPGTMRKVGPSLRGTAGKLDAAFLESWIANPSGFRANTRMPHFFGMHEHLEGNSLEDAKRFEAVEIRAVAEYLLFASQPVSPLESPPDVTETPSAERGKELFFTKGCAACHPHGDFPLATSVQGPDLTNLGSKIRTEFGRRWLVSWIRDPVRHSPRTLMPNANLAPIPLTEDPEAEGPNEKESAAAETKKPRMIDPAADIAAYLLESDGWRPADPPPLVERDLDELARMYLGKVFTTAIAQQYLKDGIPQRQSAEIQGDLRELIAPITLDKKLRYVGRRTIRKRGCFGCHDIPGFEDAQPIGPALSDWGRKQESLLAFNQVHRFLEHPRGRESFSVSAADSEGSRVESRETDGMALDSRLLALDSFARHGKRPPTPSTQTDDAFYLEAVRNQRREGFLWQKLRAPRSFDYKTTAYKPYNEQLTMGRFTLTGPQREAIATFILGLVADPPAEKYVYRPDRRGRAIVEGRKVLDKFGCAECHTLEMERWEFDYDPGEFKAPAAIPEFDFIKPHVTAEQRARSLRTDRRGRGHAEVVGMPRVDEEGTLLEDEDDDGNPLSFFTLWEPAVINGHVWPVGGADVMISGPQIAEKRPPRGGAFARLLYPFVLEQARTSGSSATELEAWGWVPPPLVHEGAVVEPSWLYGYLLNPEPVRPAAVLRMPKYNLSPDEAGKLVDYFAAVSRVEFPYTASAAKTAQPTAGDLQRLDKAMRLMTDRTTYCAKCHLIGDSGPGGDVQTVLAPDLERVGRRIRPEYLRRWLANPKSVLPYTGMPVNFPPEGPPMGQDLFQGTSLEQLDAVRELLLNYDWYLRRRAGKNGVME